MANKQAFITSVSNAVSAQQKINAAIDERFDLLAIGGHHFVEGHVAMAGVVDVAGDGKLAVRGADRAGHEPRSFGRAEVHLVDRAAGHRGGGQVELAHALGQMEVAHRDAGGAERVGLDDVCAGFEILTMDLLDGRRLGNRQNIDEVLQILRMVGELPAAKVGLGELEAWTIVPIAPSSTRIRSPSSFSRTARVLIWGMTAIVVNLRKMR